MNLKYLFLMKVTAALGTQGSAPKNVLHLVMAEKHLVRVLTAALKKLTAITLIDLAAPLDKPKAETLELAQVSTSDLTLASTNLVNVQLPSNSDTIQFE